MPPGNGWANTSAAVAWSALRSRLAGPVASKPQGPPVLAACVDLGQFHRARRTDKVGSFDELRRLLQAGKP